MKAFLTGRLAIGAVLVAGMLSWARVAGAEPIPEESLQAQQNACMTSCGTTKAGNAVCTSYCGCIRQQISTSMSMEDLMELEQALKDGKQLPQDPNDKLQNAVKICRARSQ